MEQQEEEDAMHIFIHAIHLNSSSCTTVAV